MLLYFPFPDFCLLFHFSLYPFSSLASRLSWGRESLASETIRFPFPVFASRFCCFHSSPHPLEELLCGELLCGFTVSHHIQQKQSKNHAKTMQKPAHRAVKRDTILFLSAEQHTTSEFSLFALLVPLFLHSLNNNRNARALRNYYICGRLRIREYYTGKEERKLPVLRLGEQNFWKPRLQNS